jgi:hypothetical protein
MLKKVVTADNLSLVDNTGEWPVNERENVTMRKFIISAIAVASLAATVSVASAGYWTPLGYICVWGWGPYGYACY